MNQQPPKPQDVTSTEIAGTVSKIVFQSAETGYAVLRLQTSVHQATVTLVGQLAGVAAGEEITAAGKWVIDKRFGTQFRVDRFSRETPKSVSGIAKFLASGVVPGIGEAMARRITAHFGPAALTIIEKSPERLREVEGIGPRRAQDIVSRLRVHTGQHRWMALLMQHGLGARQAQKVLRQYGAATADILAEDPYRLAEDIYGIGFHTADKLAASMGIAPESQRRARAGVLHVVNEATAGGHTCLAETELITRAVELLGVAEDIVRAGIGEALERRLFIRYSAEGQDYYYPPRLFYAEEQVARWLGARAGQEIRPLAPNAGAALAGYEKQEKITLADEQRQAVMMALTSFTVLITGGPGTGKTTIARAIAQIAVAAGAKLKLAAPTGRAAKRLQEATGLPASTIHRLLEYSPKAGKFQRDGDNPLDADLLIIDEMSMVDLPLFHALLKALPAHGRLVLIGDADQLPSVGPGRVLADLLASGVAPLVRLKEIFRQAARSLIVANAYAVLQGRRPQSARFQSAQPADFYFVERPDAEAAARLILQLVTERIPQRFAMDPFQDIQVLTPMNRGETGTARLNELLQQGLNPNGQAMTWYNCTFREGDRIIQMENDYDRDVYNGDLGTVSAVDGTRGLLRADFGGRLVEYAGEDLGELALAYAITIHKSQGSEYPAVVIPLLTAHYLLLRRELLYTAITRARRLVVLTGSTRALDLALRQEGGVSRLGFLRQRLRQGLA